MQYCLDACGKNNAIWDYTVWNNDIRTINDPVKDIVPYLNVTDFKMTDEKIDSLMNV